MFNLSFVCDLIRISPHLCHFDLKTISFSLFDTMILMTDILNERRVGNSFLNACFVSNASRRCTSNKAWFSQENIPPCIVSLKAAKVRIRKNL